MGILDRLIKRKKAVNTIVWGIRVPEEVKTRWLMLSAIMSVPANRLILFILQDWARQNTDILLNREARERLAGHIAELYLQDKLN